MIIEVHRREGLDAPLQYNIRKLEESHARIIARRFIPQDASGDEIYACLEANALNTRVKTPFFHINLNPHPDDWANGLTVDQLADMAVEAANKLFPGVPFVAFLHTDIERHHCHIVGPCITRDGKLISDRYEWNRAMRVSRELEIKYDLVRALEQTDEQRVSRAEPIIYGNGDLARKIGDVLALAATYKFGSIGEWNAFLRLYNVEAEQVNDDKKRGLSYYVLADGKRVGKAIIATKIRGGALAQIQKQIKARGLMDKDYEILRAKIKAALEASRNFEEFKESLLAMEVRTVERIGREGNVLGVTFVDDETRTIANGSNIGREYSYGNLSKTFLSANAIIFDSPSTIEITTENDRETTVEQIITTEIPVIVPDIAGLINTRSVGGVVNKSKKRRKCGI